MNPLNAITSWFKPTLGKKASQQQLGDMRFICVDLELTSLDVNEAHITSVGWVEGMLNCIALEKSQYGIIRTYKPLGQSPVIHGLTKDIVDAGESINAYIRKLSSFTDDCLWVFHNARLDLGVLDKVYRKLNIGPVTIVYIDTLQMALYELNKQHLVVPSNSASLSACRARASLPDFTAHNALDDAFATLQLCHYQLSVLGATSSTTLGELVHTGAIKTFSLGKVH